MPAIWDANANTGGHFLEACGHLGDKGSAVSFSQWPLKHRINRIFKFLNDACIVCVCVNTEKYFLSHKDRPRNKRDRQRVNSDHWWVFGGWHVSSAVCSGFGATWHGAVTALLQRGLFWVRRLLCRRAWQREEGRRGGGEGGVSVHILGSLNECHVVANGFNHNTHP